MYRFKNSLILGIALLWVLASACGQTPAMADKEAEKKPVIIRADSEANAPGFAVLELFTSEGCSSCPPADRLLRDVIEDSEEKGLAVYALSFHVDYWNRLGWKDPYSSAAFSSRQRSYAQALKSSVYTPQLVVNGKDEFVGSNRGKAAMAIKKALDTQVKKHTLEFEVTRIDRRISFSYKASEIAGPAVLNIALVESDLSQEVNRGENRGRNLKHDNVVRAFESISLDPLPGRGNLMAPEDLDVEKAHVIVYVQHPDSKHIMFAQKYDVQ